ncbi:MAG: YebC/PmpR family DNA-binding transcriptional regulator [candidate division Zixibacteria bacterium]|nr:YebC/PmpR family DNA-binding transcriptional regulator [candidate division Zixibacteria bacterium]
MSGHSKWSTIKRKKAKEDQKRGKAFSRLAREIIVAARQGGGDPSANTRLRVAIQAAKAANMPADNIARAIKRGTGEVEGAQLEEVTYEAYGPGGVAMCVEVMTDNKNRTTPEVRHILDRHGGSMAEAGSVTWMFDRKGMIIVDKDRATEEQIMEAVLDAGAEDIRESDDVFEVYCPPGRLADVTDALGAAGVEFASAEVSLVPKTVIPLQGKNAAKFVKLLEALEDHDDVQTVYANFDIPTSVMEELAAA